MPIAGPTSPTHTRLRPLPAPPGSLRGFWGERQRVNRTTSIPLGAQRLRDGGYLDNYARAADRSAPAGTTAYPGPLFLDSDVYKWLEAVAWDQGREPSDELAGWLAEFTAAIAAAQADDGYLNTYVQLGHARRYENLAHGHELYCAGHLLQAAVAAHRAAGDEALLGVARRFADHLVKTFGPGGIEDIDGHPVIEMALTELARETGDRAYLDLARYFVETRGHGRTDPRGRGDAAYFCDHLPVREAATLDGHAVRALYFAAGATDVACETDDPGLLAALERQWTNVVDAKTHLTGGMGSRWEGETFGAPFELPPDRCYCETCAAIGSVQWSWRLLLATGEARYADLIERTLYNAVLPGVSLDGSAYFYVNTLQLRGGSIPTDARDPMTGRHPWFSCACCPPNVMRTISSLGAYVATADESGLQIHQYAAGPVGTESFALDVETDYPWDGRIVLTVRAAPAVPVRLALRIPAWCVDAHVDGVPAAPGYAVLERPFAVGEAVTVDLAMPPRLIGPDGRVDAVRGQVALARGPIVYCVEQCDNDGSVDHARVDVGRPPTLGDRRDLLGGLPVLAATGRAADGTAYPLVAVPYFAWANREIGPMRVWIPVADR